VVCVADRVWIVYRTNRDGMRGQVRCIDCTPGRSKVREFSLFNSDLFYWEPVHDTVATREREELHLLLTPSPPFAPDNPDRDAEDWSSQPIGVLTLSGQDLVRGSRGASTRHGRRPLDAPGESRADHGGRARVLMVRLDQPVSDHESESREVSDLTQFGLLGDLIRFTGLPLEGLPGLLGRHLATHQYEWVTLATGPLNPDAPVRSPSSQIIDPIYDCLSIIRTEGARAAFLNITGAAPGNRYDQRALLIEAVANRYLIPCRNLPAAGLAGRELDTAAGQAAADIIAEDQVQALSPQPRSNRRSVTVTGLAPDALGGTQVTGGVTHPYVKLEDDTVLRLTFEAPVKILGVGWLSQGDAEVLLTLDDQRDVELTVPAGSRHADYTFVRLEPVRTSSELTVRRLGRDNTAESRLVDIHLF